jgi:chaperonin cofactor prefoldin
MIVKVYSKKEIEQIVEKRIEKALNFRVVNIEKAVDKLRERINDLEIIFQERITTNLNQIPLS